MICMCPILGMSLLIPPSKVCLPIDIRSYLLSLRFNLILRLLDHPELVKLDDGRESGMLFTMSRCGVIGLAAHVTQRSAGADDYIPALYAPFTPPSRPKLSLTAIFCISSPLVTGVMC